MEAIFLTQGVSEITDNYSADCIDFAVHNSFLTVLFLIFTGS